jgi:hypothetical protein
MHRSTLYDKIAAPKSVMGTDIFFDVSTDQKADLVKSMKVGSSSLEEKSRWYQWSTYLVIE